MKKSSIRIIALSSLALLLTLAFSPLTLQAASLDLGSGEGSPGGSVKLSITLSSGKGIAAISIDITYDNAVLTNPRAEIGPAARSAGKDIHSSSPSKEVFRVGILGMNVNEIPDGVVATVTFDVIPGVPSGKTIVLDSVPNASDAKGNPVKVSGSKGVIIIK